MPVGGRDVVRSWWQSGQKIGVRQEKEKTRKGKGTVPYCY